ncbi:MAG: ATP-binding cassette domain-containing protein [Syntrophales bacterium]|nr:ATP-binding cassette domain-containing protein [Syntrophales bacterium]
MESAASKELYRVINLRHRRGNHFELTIPDLTIGDGESIGLTGPSGGGKSTILSLLSFLEDPHHGKVLFGGKTITDNDSLSVRRSVTLLSQDPYLLKRSVYENVAYPLKIRGETGSLKGRVFEAMDMVGLKPDHFAGRRWHELSGGEAQRVALAARLVIRPRVLLLDEPTSGVDPANALLIKESIQTHRKKYGTSLVIASHDSLWLNSAADRVIKIYGGRIETIESANLIPGPWAKEEKDLYRRNLSDGRCIYSVSPPGEKATGILDPSEIIVSLHPPSDLSARNILAGRINRMTSHGEDRSIIIDVDIADLPLTCRLTRQGARQLDLLPGREVWLIFKASSIRWE